MPRVIDLNFKAEFPKFYELAKNLIDIWKTNPSYLDQYEGGHFLREVASKVIPKFYDHISNQNLLTCSPTELKEIYDGLCGALAYLKQLPSESRQGVLLEDFEFTIRYLAELGHTQDILNGDVLNKHSPFELSLTGCSAKLLLDIFDNGDCA